MSRNRNNLFGGLGLGLGLGLGIGLFLSGTFSALLCPQHHSMLTTAGIVQRPFKKVNVTLLGPVIFRDRGKVAEFAELPI